MRVTLTQPEIQAAVVRALAQQGVKVDGSNISLTFTMGRKNTGLSATVDIVDPDIKELPPVAVEKEDQVVETSSADPEPKQLPWEENEVATPVASAAVVDQPVQPTPKTLFGS